MSHHDEHGSKHHVQQMQRKRTCNRQQCVNAAQVSCRKSEKKMLVIPWKEQDVESPEEGVEQRSKDVERDSTQRHIAKLWLFTSVCVFLLRFAHRHRYRLVNFKCRGREWARPYFHSWYDDTWINARKMSFRLYRLCVVKSSDPWVYGALLKCLDITHQTSKQH